MLDIIAPDQHQPAASIDRCGIDHGKPRLATARRVVAEPSAAESAQQPEGGDDQDEHDRERDQELHVRQVRQIHFVILVAPLVRCFGATGYGRVNTRGKFCRP